MSLKKRPNLKVRMYLSFLIWGAYFGVGFLINFTFLRQYYGLIWTISSLIAILPYLYWAYLPVRFAKESGIGPRSDTYYKICLVILPISFALLVFSFAAPDAIIEYNLQGIPDISGFLFFASLFTCFIIGSRSLVKAERQLLNKSSNGFLAFLMFVYLVIGVFFLVGRMKKLYDNSVRVFD